MAKTKKVVEHRWFPATSETGVLGGIVAETREQADRWSDPEIYSGHSGFTLVRVRLEYKIPAKKRKASDY
jgi:hypothetical protein